MNIFKRWVIKYILYRVINISDSSVYTYKCLQASKTWASGLDIPEDLQVQRIYWNLLLHWNFDWHSSSLHPFSS